MILSLRILSQREGVYNKKAAAKSEGKKTAARAAGEAVRAGDNASYSMWNVKSAKWNWGMGNARVRGRVKACSAPAQTPYRFPNCILWMILIYFWHLKALSITGSAYGNLYVEAAPCLGISERETEA